MSYKTIAIKVAKQAGEIIKDAFEKTYWIKSKTKHDIVSEIDYQSEQIIIKIIKSSFPDHSIVSEELGKQTKYSEYRWYIDPLDGTSNFVTGNPYFSVSLALAFKNEIILGVVFNPILNELYYTEKNKGAFLNEKLIKVSKKINIKDALLASAYSAKEDDIKKGLKTIEKLALTSRKVVINFSPALNLCNVARGKLDGLIDNGTTPEDHAAGSLIVTEAGGKVQNYNSNSWNVNKIGIIASNKKLFNQILKII